MLETEEKSLGEKQLNIMKIRILKLEKDNLKTGEKTTDQMVDGIRKIISDEISKTY